MLVAQPVRKETSQKEQRQGASGLARCLNIISMRIDEAKERVRRGARQLSETHSWAPFNPSDITDMLASSLHHQLLAMMARVLVLELNVARLEGVLEGCTPEERFDSFVERLSHSETAAQLLDEYFVMTEQVQTRLDLWAAFSLEFLQHLTEDWHEIRQAFFPQHPGALSGIRGGAGDTHRQGRSVIVATFASGAKLVYKPRSLAVDQQFQDLLGWFNDRGVSPPFRPLRILDRTTHGWCEFISAKACTDASELTRFYRRQGTCLAVLYALNACDFHHENLIASGEHPVLIDLEALFHPRVDDQEEDAGDTASETLGYSVLHTGLLPRRYGFARDYDGVDLSGMSRSDGQLSPSEIPQWDRANTDEMHLVRRRVEVPPSDNTPTLEGQPVSAFDYSDDVAEGFRCAYLLILANRGDLSRQFERFGSAEVRVIARATQSYGAVLQESYHPDLLRDPAARHALFQRLGESVGQSSSRGRLLDAECRDLLRGDIPLFRTQPSSRDLWTSDGERIPNFLSEPAMDLVQRRLQNMCEQDLERQLWIVRASMSTLCPLPAHASTIGIRKVRATDEYPGVANAEEFLDAARKVGDRLEQLSLPEKGGTGWIGLSMANELYRYLTPLGPDLYDGIPGLVFFLAYLGNVSGDSRYSDLAHSAARNLRSQLKASDGWHNVGGFAGLGGVVYALVHASAALGDPALLGEAEGQLDRILSAIPEDEDFDIIAGSAGCALGVGALHSVQPSAKTLQILRNCGERLVQTERQMPAGVGWLCIGAEDVPLTGFAHGNAGIAYALLTIARCTGDARFERSARAAIAYERARFSRDRRNWPDLRPHGTFANAWCHGAPGIALSRLCSKALAEDSGFAEEIDAGLATTLSHGFGGAHVICHGDLGNADILLHAANVLNNTQWEAEARRAATRVLRGSSGREWNCGLPLDLETPGLMSGLAGIGYALLRMASPERVPCLLALEVPRMS